MLTPEICVQGKVLKTGTRQQFKLCLGYRLIFTLIKQLLTVGVLPDTKQ